MVLRMSRTLPFASFRFNQTKLLKVITFFSSAVGRKCSTYYFGRTSVEK